MPSKSKSRSGVQNIKKVQNFDKKHISGHVLPCTQNRLNHITPPDTAHLRICTTLSWPVYSSFQDISIYNRTNPAI